MRHQLGDVTDLETLLNYLYSGRLSERNKSMAILACQRGLTNDTICRFLGISSNTLWNYKRTFAKGASDALFSRKPSSSRKSNDEALKNAIFKILHEPPSNYGINRTSWTMSFLRDALRANGRTACPGVIRGITRVAGYHWRKARVVLTSADPKYSEKLDRIHSILSNLQPDEAFFSIDEYGPFAVKAYGGRTLVAPGEQPVVHQWQKTRGSLILTAALELSSNQITHFYSNRKNTDEMIKLMDILIIKYANRRKIYLSWDVASWHIAKRLNQCIETHNAKVAAKGGVVVETAPLPSGAQFLNVIELGLQLGCLARSFKTATIIRSQMPGPQWIGTLKREMIFLKGTRRGLAEKYGAKSAPQPRSLSQATVKTRATDEPRIECLFWVKGVDLMVSEQSPLSPR